MHFQDEYRVRIGPFMQHLIPGFPSDFQQPVEGAVDAKRVVNLCFFLFIF